MKNSEVAKVLYDIADMLELQNVDFKPQAYRKAARSIEELPEEIEQVYSNAKREGLMQIKGVGEGISERLEELLLTGKMKYYTELKKKFPKHISALIEVPGLGPKKIKKLHERLKISSIEELEKAIQKHKVSEIEGFGEKTEEEILKGIELVKAGKKRILLKAALEISEEIISRINATGYAEKTIAAGSLRRMQETIGDIDILAVSANPAKVMEFFTTMKGVKRVLAKGGTKSSILMKDGLQIDLRVVEGKNFGAALQYFTGNIQHNVKLREIAIKKGCKLNEYGIFDGKNSQVAGKTEQEVYKFLGMGYIEPELRTDSGEIEAAMSRNLPKLIEYGTVRGDLHCHTSKTDGYDSLPEMADAAKRQGLDYIAITDHSVSERVASGLKEEEMEKWLMEIREYSRKVKGIRILAGSEVSIKPDGTLDYSDDLLKKMDIVIASVHSRFKSSREEMTRRITKALSNKNVDILGHPTGRLIHQREPYEADMQAVIKAAAENKVLLEINSQPGRMDLKDIHVKQAKYLGAKFVINTDSHSINELRNINLGIAIARRGWLEPKDVVNTRALKELPKFFRKIRD